MQELVAPKHVAHFVRDIVREELDLTDIFVLELCQRIGLAKLGHVALDLSKLAKAR